MVFGLLLALDSGGIHDRHLRPSSVARHIQSLAVLPVKNFSGIRRRSFSRMA